MRNKLRILIVDDDRLLCQFLVDLLSIHQVDVQTHAEEALRTLPMSYDAILVDGRMRPMDGKGFVRAVQSKYEAANRTMPRIVGFTAYEPEAEEFRKLNVEVLRKPFTLSALLAALGAIVWIAVALWMETQGSVGLG